MGKIRKALAALLTTGGGTFGTMLWAVADGGVTGGELSAAAGAAVAVGVAAALAVFGVRNDDTVNLGELPADVRRQVELALAGRA